MPHQTVEGKPKKCFVMMPSGNRKEYAGERRESDFIFTSIIAPAVKDACGPHVEIIREADTNASGAIDKEIVKHIATADIAIVDLTGHNANVFLELGIRYALKKSTTILLRQRHTVIPFDIGTYRCVDYDPFYEGIEGARRGIADAIATSLGVEFVDSLVYNAYPTLSVQINPDEDRGARDQMPWDEFWSRFAEIESRLKQIVDDGLYRPHIILGMSNGGMFVADMLGRRLLPMVPIATLWVNRLEPTGEWFENCINDAVVMAIKELAPNGDISGVEILLVDDIVSSGKTIQEALKFLDKHLANASIRFLPIFSANHKYYELIRAHIIWRHSAFAAAFPNESQIQSLHTTQRRRLPYDKDIRSS